MNILIFNGASGSSSRKISDVVIKTLGEKHNYKIMSPTWLHLNLRRAVTWINTTEGPILMVGKSLGGENIHALLCRLRGTKREIYVVLVDPHGYGYGKFRALRGPEGVVRKGVCIYQHNHYPNGAKWQGFRNLKIASPAVDHSNIVDLPLVAATILRFAR